MTKNKLQWASGLIALLLLSACEPIVVKTRSELSHANPADNYVEYECDSSPSGKCHFVLFTQSCTTATPEPETEVNTCTTKTVARFSIDAGQKHIVKAPPASFKECHGSSEKLAIPDCAEDNMLNKF